MKTILTALTLSILSTSAFAAPTVTCKALKWKENSREMAEESTRCEMFQDPEFGLSAECELSAFGNLKIKGNYLFGTIDTFETTLNGVTNVISEIENAHILDSATGNQYYVSCQKD